MMMMTIRWQRGSVVKVKALHLYSATSSNCSCSGTVRRRISGHTAYRLYAKPAATQLTYDKQVYTAIICRLMVSTPVIHVIYLDYYSFTDPNEMES